MTRRLQLLDAESRSSGRGVSAALARVRDGLLRDNKVVPAVLGVLAILIFAWLVAGALMSGSGDEEQQQAANQASLAQGDDSDSGDTETTAPGVENRDTDASYGGYDEGPKDPFRQLLPKADEEDGGSGQDDRGGDEDDRGGEGTSGARAGNGRDGNTTGRGGNDRGGDEDFTEQRSPGGSGSRGVPGRGGSQGGASQGGASQDSAGQAGPVPGGGGQGGGGQGKGGGGLFNSGGDLPAP